MTNNYGYNKPVAPAGTVAYKDGSWKSIVWFFVIFTSIVMFLVYKGIQNESLTPSTAVEPRYERVKEYTYQTPILRHKGIVSDYWKIKMEYERQFSESK